MEDFGYKKNNETPSNQFLTRKIFYFSATLLSLSIFIFISLKAYKLINSNNKEIETIKGPSEPIKIYEDNDYNNKNVDRVVNRSIYDDIFGNRKDMIQEEVKIKKNNEPPLPPKNLKEENSDDASTKENPNSENPQLSNDESIQKTSTEEPAISKQLNAKNIKSPPSEEKIASENSQNKSPILKRKRSIRVQISAMSSKENCEEYYKKLSRLYPNIFSRTKYYVESADLGKRGIFYRLQVGDFYNQVDAEEFCSGFISQTQKTRSECIIVE